MRGMTISFGQRAKCAKAKTPKKAYGRSWRSGNPSGRLTRPTLRQPGHGGSEPREARFTPSDLNLTPYWFGFVSVELGELLLFPMPASPPTFALWWRVCASTPAPAPSPCEPDLSYSFWFVSDDALPLSVRPAPTPAPACAPSPPTFAP